MITPELRSGDLLLDRVTPFDTDLVLEYCLDPELQRYTRVPVPYTRTDAAFFTGIYATEAERGTDVCLWAIRTPDDAAAIMGTIELRFLSPTTAELGYWLGAPHRGRGIMTTALGLVADHAFSPEGFALETLHWDAVAGNSASAIVAKRIGFTFLGERPSHIAIRDELHGAWLAELHATDSRTPRDGWPV